jgi:hypothetical protein
VTIAEAISQEFSPDLLAVIINQLSEDEQSAVFQALRDEEHGHLDELCKREVANFQSGPAYWITSGLTCTENPKAAQQGLPYRHPFPKKTFTVELFKAFLGVEPYSFPNPAKPRLFIPKSRELMTSWAVMAYATWRAQWHNWECLVQTESLEKDRELIDYCSQLWRNQKDWLRDRHPLANGNKEPNTFSLNYEAGGRVIAIPSGAHKIRLYHPTLYVLDEAAFLPEAQACYDTAHPVAAQIIGISSAAPSWFGDECQTQR